MPSRTGTLFLSDRSATLSSPSMAPYQTVQTEFRPPPHNPAPLHPEYTADGPGFGEGGGSMVVTSARLPDRMRGAMTGEVRCRPLVIMTGAVQRVAGPGSPAPPPMGRPLSSAVVGIKNCETGASATIPGIHLQLLPESDYARQRSSSCA